LLQKLCSITRLPSETLRPLRVAHARHNDRMQHSDATDQGCHAVMNQDPERIHDAYAPVHILPRPQCATRGGAEDLDDPVAALPPGSWEPGVPYPAAEAPPNAPAMQPGQGRTPTTTTPHTVEAATGGSPADTPTWRGTRRARLPRYAAGPDRALTTDRSPITAAVRAGSRPTPVTDRDWLEPDLRPDRRLRVAGRCAVCAGGCTQVSRLGGLRTGARLANGPWWKDATPNLRRRRRRAARPAQSRLNRGAMRAWHDACTKPGR
jgi:hypothetical protein